MTVLIIMAVVVGLLTLAAIFMASQTRGDGLWSAGSSDDSDSRDRYRESCAGGGCGGGCGGGGCGGG